MADFHVYTEEVTSISETFYVYAIIQDIKPIPLCIRNLAIPQIQYMVTEKELLNIVKTLKEL